MIKKYHEFHLHFTIKIVNFKEKSVTFNTFFAEQCSLIPNKSVLLSQLTLLTENSLSKDHFSKKDILQIIRNLESSKVNGHDKISIRMLKPFGVSICKPLKLIYRICLQNGRFPLKCKKCSPYS